MISRASQMFCVLAGLLLVGCSSEVEMTDERLAEMAGGTLKETVPVSGTVSVDDVPVEGVNLSLYPAGGGAAIANCRTAWDGTYCWSTHQSCDGVEPGSYLVGFAYVPKEKKNDTGVDELKGKYAKPKKGEFELTVESGMPQTGVDYDLKTTGK